MKTKIKKYNEGFFIGLGISIGILLSIIPAILIKNISFVSIGFVLGLAIGIAIEKEYKEKGRIISFKKDEKTKMNYILIIIIFVLIILFSLIIFLIR